jgi:mRNA export factor
MDVREEMIVIGTADRNLHVLQANAPNNVKVMQSQLKWQTRCVSVFPDKKGFLVGSIEGRVAVTHINDAESAKNFTFKCHRFETDIYAVNSIAFQQTFGTFVTAGSDGTYNFWDKDSKQRLKAQNKANYQTPAGLVPAAITCGSFDRTGVIYAYAIGYDWSKGYVEHNPTAMKPSILLHVCKEEEVKAKPKAAAVSDSTLRYTRRYHAFCVVHTHQLVVTSTPLFPLSGSKIVSSSTCGSHQFP